MKKKTMKTSVLVMAAAMLTAVAVTGCGNSSSGGTAASGTTAASTSGNTVSDNAGSDGVSADVQKIINTGVLKVGSKIDVPKFGLQNTATGEMEGLEVDLAYEIAGEIFGCTADEAKAKKLVSFQGVTAKTRGPLLDNGEVDLVIATFTITDERKEAWNFSTPYYKDAVGLMVLKESGITSIQDLDGKVIGVSQGSTTKNGFIAYCEANSYDIKPEFEEFDGYPSIAAALSAKNIDVFSVDRAILAGYNGDSTIILEDRFAEQEYGVASKLDNKDLAELVEHVVSGLKDSGKMGQMLTEWGIE